MNPLVPLLWMAGCVQLAIFAANFLLPGRLAVRVELPRLSPILRQVFLVHWAYILFVLLIFAALSFLFASELAGGSTLGRAMSACMALFWSTRILIQLFYYDAALKRENRAGNILFTSAFTFLAAVFTAAALGAGR